VAGAQRRGASGLGGVAAGEAALDLDFWKVPGPMGWFGGQSDQYPPCRMCRA
jgi:hypothetical protein